MLGSLLLGNHIYIGPSHALMYACSHRIPSIVQIRLGYICSIGYNNTLPAVIHVMHEHIEAGNLKSFLPYTEHCHSQNCT